MSKSKKSKTTKSKTHKLGFGVEQRSVDITRSDKNHFFSDVYYEMLSLNWTKFLIFISVAYFAINLVFGLLYFSIGRTGLTGNHPADQFSFFIECFFFSVQTFSTIGYGAIAPISFLTNIVVSLQALVGMLSIGLTSGLFFSRFTRPSAKIIFSEQILITNHLGKRSLVFRLANSRVNTIVNAKIYLTFNSSHKTAEGTSMRILKDLKLVRDFNSIFFLNWVVAHVIDEASPLFNMSRQDLEEISSELMISFSGMDQTFGQPIHTAKVYPASQVVYDRNFADMLIRDDKGIRVDLDNISVLV